MSASSWILAHRYGPTPGPVLDPVFGATGRAQERGKLKAHRKIVAVMNEFARWARAVYPYHEVQTVESSPELSSPGEVYSHVTILDGPAFDELVDGLRLSTVRPYFSDVSRHGDEVTVTFSSRWDGGRWTGAHGALPGSGIQLRPGEAYTGFCRR